MFWSVELKILIRSDYNIVLDRGETFIWIYWASLSASMHAEIVFEHLWPYVTYYSPYGFLLVSTIAHYRSEDSCAHLVVILEFNRKFLLCFEFRNGMEARVWFAGWSFGIFFIFGICGAWSESNGVCHNLTVHLLINRGKGWGFGGEMHPRLVVISITSMSTLLEFVTSILKFLWAWTLVETHPKLIARYCGHSSCNSRQN